MDPFTYWETPQWAATLRAAGDHKGAKSSPRCAGGAMGDAQIGPSQWQ